LNELVRSTSFTLTIYTIPYPQGHTGLQKSGNPSAAAPFLLDKKDTIPVYRLMHQTFNDNLQQHHSTEALTEPRDIPTDPGTDGKGNTLTLPPRPRKLWASGQRASEAAKYKGHVLEVLIEAIPTESIGNTVHKILLECYPLRSTVPAPDTLHYTLGEFPSNLVWAQEQTPEHSLHLNAMTGREISLSCEDKLEWITKKDSLLSLLKK